jgi:lactate dehydrogenase-like 2-hydroxyacid dehydrogenase
MASVEPDAPLELLELLLLPHAASAVASAIATAIEQALNNRP